jgi:dihydropteroate synthase
MPREGGVSFRVLHPDPADFYRIFSLAPEIDCLAEFSIAGPAKRLALALGRLPYIHHLQTGKKSKWIVYWKFPWSQCSSLSKNLKDFPELTAQIQKALKIYERDDFWRLKGRGKRAFQWSHKTQIMGILNVTPDSFSDGGCFLDPAAAVDQSLQMQEAGADWIDIGGESTRPGAKAVSTDEEEKRILPVIHACAKALRIPMSVDTYKSEVALAAVGEGAQLINDIGALGLDPQIGKVAARLGVPVILMHMQGKPRTMQKKPVYRDVVGDILAFFRQRISYARQCGIAEESILLDPGFGFGKTPWHNIELTRRLWEFKVLGRPLVFGPSRKSTLGFLLGGAPPVKRLEATGAAVTAAILKGADFVRVHDVQSIAPMVKIADAIRYDRGLSTP